MCIFIWFAFHILKKLIQKRISTNPNIEYKQEELMLMIYEIDSITTQKNINSNTLELSFSLDSLFLVEYTQGQN